MNAANATERFSDRVADYVRYRPDYPHTLLSWLQDELGVANDWHVADVGAGTGISSRMFLDAGYRVTAVEPNAAMRAAMTAWLGGVDGFRAVDGSADATGLPDGGVDLVTVAQAFHWFDFDAALAEIRRVLRPGGALAILFNQRDERTPWVDRWNAVIEWHSRVIARYQATDWTALLGGHGFVAVGDAHVEWDQPMTRDLVAARVRSVSYIAEEPRDVQQEYVDRVLALVDGFDEPFPLPSVTHVWWCRTPS
jgi:SAM-dependent methyltransferase